MGSVSVQGARGLGCARGEYQGVVGGCGSECAKGVSVHGPQRAVGSMSVQGVNVEGLWGLWE